MKEHSAKIGTFWEGPVSGPSHVERSRFICGEWRCENVFSYNVQKLFLFIRPLPVFPLLFLHFYCTIFPLFWEHSRLSQVLKLICGSAHKSSFDVDTSISLTIPFKNGELISNKHFFVQFAGALVYRVFPPANADMKYKLKLLHASTMATIFVLVVIALQVGCKTTRHCFFSSRHCFAHGISRVRNLRPTIGARNRVGIWLLYRPASLCSLAM